MSTLTSITDSLGDSSEADPRRLDLVELLLAEQQSLSAVERFDAEHDSAPARGRFYRASLPATPPGPGQQYAFSVDLDTCSGCKACVVACHTMNGLEEDESWRRVGTVRQAEENEGMEETFLGSRVQHVTTACHHCVDPGCLNGCPVKAYEKDPITGIVRHLDDQCIGCKYCTMMCPYEVPRYSDRLGIVRKCDMCQQRLGAGEAPACVQSCPNDSISITVVDVTDQDGLSKVRLAPGAPLSSITKPTTRYHRNGNRPRPENRPISKPGDESTGTPGAHANGNPFRGAVPQDAGMDQPAESHWPLALMLVATQLSVGMLLIEWIAMAIFSVVGLEMSVSATAINAAAAMLIGGLGMGVAPLHLGQPSRAWRVFLGLRTSWLSREAIVLGNYMGVLLIAVALLWLPAVADLVSHSISDRIPAWAGRATLGVACLFGTAGLYCSAMIYIATQRDLWRAPRTLPRFFGTALGGGASMVAVCWVIGGASRVAVAAALALAGVAMVIKLTWEWRIYLGGPRHDDDSYDRRSRRLVAHQLPRLRDCRIALGIAAVGLAVCGSGSALIIGETKETLMFAVLFAIALSLGECCERLLYFSSVVYDRMPGTFR